MSDSALPPSGYGTGYVTGGKSSGPSPSPSSTPSRTGALNAMAVASFVLVFVAGILAPVTIVMAYVAKAQIRRSGQAGGSLAKAAIVISCVYLAAGTVVAMLYAFVV